MKHAVIVAKEYSENNNCLKGLTSDGREIWLYEKEYDNQEQEAFQAQTEKWLMCRRGTRYFLADHDSGEDAEGSYGKYFELLAERAVFHGDRCIGVYYSFGSLQYSGSSRASFGIDNWGYPGSDPFNPLPWPTTPRIFFFNDPVTHTYNDWYLEEKEEGKDYSSYLDF